MFEVPPTSSHFFQHHPKMINAQEAIWNCVFYFVHVYQKSILIQVVGLIHCAIQAKDNASELTTVDISRCLKKAVRNLNVDLVTLRSKALDNGIEIQYNTKVMSKIIWTQNKLIMKELRKQGIELSSLLPELDIAKELKKRSDAAYLAVKAKIAEAKRK